MRQYEKGDCLEDAVLGKGYDVIKYSSTNGCRNCCELAIGFGNPETKQVAWVPFGSKISLNDSAPVEFYVVVQGAEFSGRKMDSKPSFEISCLQGSDGKLKSLYDIVGKQVKVEELSLDDMDLQIKENTVYSEKGIIARGLSGLSGFFSK